MLFIVATVLSGCYDREILDSKPGNSIDPVKNLNYIVNEPEIEFTWELPSSFPDDIIHPVSVVITVFKDDTQVATITVADAPTSYTYTDYDSGSIYRFIFKVRAEVDTDELNESKLRYSKGVVVTL